MTERKPKISYRAADRIPDPDPFGGRPPFDEIEIRKRTYVVAKVQPLDVSGVRTVMVGTVLWLVALLVLLPFYSTLKDNGQLWWLGTCGTGVGLGLLGLEYCRRRRRHLARHPKAAVETSPLGAAGL